MNSFMLETSLKVEKVLMSPGPPANQYHTGAVIKVSFMDTNLFLTAYEIYKWRSHGE